MVSVNTSTSGAIRTKLLKDWPISRDCILRANYREADSGAIDPGRRSVAIADYIWSDDTFPAFAFLARHVTSRCFSCNAGGPVAKGMAPPGGASRNPKLSGRCPARSFASSVVCFGRRKRVRGALRPEMADPVIGMA